MDAATLAVVIVVPIVSVIALCCLCCSLMGRDGPELSVKCKLLRMKCPKATVGGDVVSGYENVRETMKELIERGWDQHLQFAVYGE